MVSQIGFIGLGTIGYPVCRNLAESGIAVVAHDGAPKKERMEELTRVGVRLVEFPEAVADSSEVVIALLPHSEAVESVLLSPAFLKSVTPGTVCVDMSSGYPATTARMAHVLAERGVGMVDAPICNGGVKGAYERRLVLCAGGDPAPFQTVRPLLERVAAIVLHVGPLGAGHAMKVINNAIIEGFWAVIAENLALGVGYGFDLSELVKNLKACSAGVPQFGMVAEMCAQPVQPDTVFQLYLGTKDLRYASRLAGELRVPHVTTDAAHAMFVMAEKVLGPRAESWTGPWRLLEYLRAHAKSA
jgi:3-hydroxyisobutyrate dehydrogenase